MGRESLRIHVSMFWSRSSPSSFYQNFKSPNIPFAPSKYQNFDLPDSLQRLLVARDTVIFLLQHFDFVTNFKKSVMEPVQTIEYFGLAIDSIRMTLSLTEDKVNGILQECKIIF